MCMITNITDATDHTEILCSRDWWYSVVLPEFGYCI